MAVAVREHLEGATTSAGTIGLTTGAGTAVGDLMVMLHLASFYPAASMLAPSGGGTWSGPVAIARNDGTNSPHIKAWWVAVSSGGAQAVQVNHVESALPHHAHLLVLTGADLVAPFPAGSFGVLDNAFDTAQVAPSVTGVTGGLLVGAWISDDTITYTAPGSMTGYPSGNGYSAALSAVEVLAAGGATGTRTATSSAAKTHTAIAVAVSPAAAATAAPRGPMRPLPTAVHRASRW